MGSDADEDDGGGSDGNVPRRTGDRNGLLEWVLVDGDRLLLTLLISVGVFASLLVFYRFGVIEFTNDDSLTRMASGMIAGSFSLVTIVVSVNQLILSQEFSPAGQFRDRFGGVMEFRRDVEEATGVPSAPATPTRLLELLAANIRHRANALAETAGPADDHYRDRITRYARGVSESTRRIDETLDGANVTAFDALVATVEYDNSWQLHAARHLRDDAPTLPEETERAFDDLIDALRLFGTAQAHFKTVYLQRELTRFSQLTVFCGVPAVGAAVLIALLYGDVGGTTIRLGYSPYVISALVTVVSVPVGLLAAYILRTATLTRRTVAVGPMILRKDPDEGPFDVSYDETE